MKPLLFALSVAMLPVGVSAHAGESASEPASLTIPCPARHLPSEADAVRVFDQHNFGKVYELRQQALDLARRECRPGVTYIRVVAAPKPRPAAPRLLAKH